MKAIVHDRYGSPDVLQLKDVDKPQLSDDGMLVRVRASSVNAVDWHLMRGEPVLARLQAGLRRPKDGAMGVDVAGVVEAVGKDVTDFKPGEEVFGTRSGAFGEYVVSTKRAFALKPAGLTFEEVAAVPVAATTALQALRDHGQVKAGQKVLVNGAGGGVGSFAVQIAKALGAEVTAVTSAENVDELRSLGADRVIDYTQEDFTKTSRHHDLILDIGGNRSLRDTLKALTPTGTLVIIGGPPGKLLGPLGRVLRAMVLRRFVKQRMVFFIAETTKEDMSILKEMLESGQIRPVIDRTYPLSQAADAVRYVETGRARGKVVINVT